MSWLELFVRPGQLNKLALDLLLLHSTPSLQSGLLSHNPSLISKQIPDRQLGVPHTPCQASARNMAETCQVSFPLTKGHFLQAVVSCVAWGEELVIMACVLWRFYYELTSYAGYFIHIISLNIHLGAPEMRTFWPREMRL